MISAELRSSADIQIENVVVETVVRLTNCQCGKPSGRLASRAGLVS